MFSAALEIKNPDVLDSRIRRPGQAKRNPESLFGELGATKLSLPGNRSVHFYSLAHYR